MTNSLATDWDQVNPGFWVARRDADLVGSVEQGDELVATDLRGRVLGSFDDIVAAQRAVERTVSGRRSAPQSKGPRRRLVEWSLILALPVTGFVVIAAIAGTAFNS